MNEYFDKYKQESIEVVQNQLEKLNNAVLAKSEPEASANLVPRRSIHVSSNKLLNATNQNVYLEKNTRISFDMLTRLSYENSIVAAVVNTRANQISNFSRPTNNKYQLGYRMRLINEEEEPTPEDRQIMSEIEQWLLTCGNNEGRHFRDRCTFEDFLKTTVRDRLVSDQCSVELIPDKKGDIHHFIPVDGSSVRYINEDFDRNLVETMRQSGAFNVNFEKDRLSDGEYAFVQVYDSRILQGFAHEDMIIKHANPVVKLGLNGYPIGELEQVVNQITSYLFGETHTRLYFMQGVSAKGILHIKDDIPEDELEAFRSHFYAQLTGNQNAWRTPIMAGVNDVKWLELGNQNKDMEWAKWLEYLIKIICGIYLIDPSEINFDIVRGGGNTINEGNRNAILLQASRDKGLMPLVRFVEGLVNDILDRKNPEIRKRYVFEFTGLRTADLMTDIDRWTKEVQHFKTVNEVRKENDLPEIEDGDIILNQVFTSYKTALMQQEQQKELQEQMMEQQMDGGISPGPDGGSPEEEVAPEEPQEEVTEEPPADAEKSIPSEEMDLIGKIINGDID